MLYITFKMEYNRPMFKREIESWSWEELENMIVWHLLDVEDIDKIDRIFYVYE